MKNTPEQIKRTKEIMKEHDLSVVHHNTQYKEDMKNYIGEDMPVAESLKWFAVQLLGGLIICAILSGIAATIAQKLF